MNSRVHSSRDSRRMDFARALSVDSLPIAIHFPCDWTEKRLSMDSTRASTHFSTKPEIPSPLVYYFPKRRIPGGFAAGAGLLRI